MTINGTDAVLDGTQTVYEAARLAGIVIPTLCHRDGLHPLGGCGVCTVEDTTTGRLLPACATRAHVNMAIQTDSAAALQVRRDALELLLSNHPADCEAPCQLACPSGLPVPSFLEAISEGRWATARAMAQRYPVICAPVAPCEKACRRKPLGGAVAICALHRWLTEPTIEGENPEAAPLRPAQQRFRSRMTGLSKEVLLSFCTETGDRRLPGQETTDLTPETAMYEASRCLQCGCRKPDTCRLRSLCTQTGAKQSAFAGICGATVREQSGRFRFDAARCVLCGLCVRLAQQKEARIAPAFHGRGFSARIAPPLGRSWDDVPEDVLAACAAACPTGAMVFMASSADGEEQENTDRPQRV